MKEEKTEGEGEPDLYYPASEANVYPSRLVQEHNKLTRKYSFRVDYWTGQPAFDLSLIHDPTEGGKVAIAPPSP